MNKVMFFRPLFYMGGTEIAILNLVKKLKGFEIYIGYTDETSDKDLLNRFKKYAKVINIDKIDELEIDDFIGCSMHYHLVPAVQRIKRKRTILWVHHLINIETSALLAKEEHERLDSVVCVSKTIADKLKIFVPELAHKIHAIYNVIDKREIKSLSKETVSLKLSKTLNLVTVSRVCKAKGFSRMLYLAKALKDAKVDFKWFIVGNNYYKDEYDEIVKEYEPYKKNFEWFGFKDNPHSIVKQCDYSVLLSDDETWGLVLTEAMILGVPCIATDFDVVYEQIRDKENGIILSRDNVDSYKDRIDDILNNKGKYKKAVSNFNYDNDKVLDEWTNYLNYE